LLSIRIIGEIMARVRGNPPLSGRIGKLLILLTAPLAVLASLADPGAASARATTPAASAGGPGHWSQVTPATSEIIADIGLVRGSDGVLHVLWLAGTSPYSINDTPISANGTVHAKTVVASGWFIATYPDATMTSSGLAVLWNGDQGESGPSGTFEATRPHSAGHWSISPTVVPPIPSAPYESSSDAAAAGADGQPWVAFSGTNSLIVDHLGNAEVQISPDKCCLYEQALATDGESGQAWVAYSSLITGNQGLFARKLKPSGQPAAPQVLLPGSRGDHSTIVPLQRVAITGRGKGRSGVYVAYGAGYPVYRSLDVLRLGTRTPVKLAKFGLLHQLNGTDIAADPAGRLWVAWYVNGGSPGLFVRRSGTAGAGFGKTARIPLPAGTKTVWKVYISAQAGRLDVLLLLSKHGSSKAAYWSTQVLPPK
jgi:hypothetical protein